MRHDMVKQFNVDCKAECSQLNPAHVTKKLKKCKKKKQKQARRDEKIGLRLTEVARLDENRRQGSSSAKMATH